MESIIIFFGILVAFVVIAKIVNAIKGVKASYIDSFRPDSEEQTLFEEKEGDFYSVSRLGQAKIMSFARLKRTHAIFTSKRIIIGQKAFLSKKYMITHILYYDTTGHTGRELTEITGGLYSLGYQVFSIFKDQITLEKDGNKSFLKLIPVPTTSATNVEHMRIYSDGNLTKLVEGLQV